MSNNTSDNLIALSIDVEDWFTVRNMREVVDEKDWDKQDFRIHLGMDFLLDELEKRNIRATFFILGWVAEKCPEMVKRIDELGHEIGSHGYSHTPIDLLTPETFEADLVKSLQVISGITGRPVAGFRAPSFSITKKTMWAMDILEKHGLRYDSSIFSTIHPDYGINGFPTKITKVKSLLEVPLRKGKFFGAHLPVFGGGYFRMFPYWMIKSSLKQTLKEGSLVMYFHPWEFDPGQPRAPLKGLKKFRHYVGLNSNRKKFLKLLDDFHFTTIANLIEWEKKKEILH